MQSFLHRCLLFLLLWNLALPTHASQEETCVISENGEETCQASNDDPESWTIQVINQSPYRVDVYWDDGQFGLNLATLEMGGESAGLNVFAGHSFFVTRHGVQERLFVLDSQTNQEEPLIWKATKASDTEWILPPNAKPSDNPCQDRFSICADAATRTQCMDSPGWMIVHCCASCDAFLDARRLIDPKERCSPEHLNTTDPIWKPGDLNLLFEDWATNPEYAPLQPKVLSTPNPAQFQGKEVDSDSRIPQGPWVMIFDNFLSSDEADALIRGGELVGFDRSTDQGAVNAAGEMEKVVSTTRTSSNAWCTGVCEQLPEVSAVTQRIEQVTKIPRSHFESFQILEYGHNQFYRRHHDSSNGKDDTPPGHRILTFFLYLTDVEEGGETYFNQLDLAVSPKKGRALVWPSVLNDTPHLWDPRMFHEAKDVIRGTKYAANHWIHYNDYVTPNRWGCTGSFS
eukprot:Nitzschia sp. Nitz4//scaffold313_size41840//31735//33102//NITZ4_007439-RA/size41840-processed-gene-0.14-mRNA-1//-1//CDS//3329547439//2205//frame0